MALREKECGKKAPPPGFEPGIPKGTGFQDQRNTGLCDSGMNIRIYISAI